MVRLLSKALLGWVFLVVSLGVAVFVPAGGFGDWRAWAAICVFGGVSLGITIDLAIRDPALLARRTRVGPLAEQRLAQKLGQAAASLAFLAIFVLAGFDRRWGWSVASCALAVIGDVVIAAGLMFVAIVFRANTFTAATIQVDRAQQIVTTGPYAIVRHPMYAGALVMLLGFPLALGSWWSYAPVAVLALIIVWRATDEERVLVAELPGYAEYRAKVRARLLPGVW
jgi:protein-S-isoprenylcysteine O-methyltransferase Ste14